MSEQQHAMTLRLDNGPWRQLRIEAFEREITISDVIREAVDDHLANRALAIPTVTGDE